ncbi:lamin tail domain-containing protein [Thermococcus sp.]
MVNPIYLLWHIIMRDAMKRGQSSLEYLFMIAVALVMVAVVVHHLAGITSSIPGSSGVVISYVDYDPPGDDVEGEYVVIENEGLSDVDLTGWQLRDEANHAYTFPTGFILKAGASVRVHTGEGTDTDTDLYWGRKQAVWNNNGDTAYLYNAEGKLVDKCSWTGDEGGAVTCH